MKNTKANADAIREAYLKEEAEIATDMMSHEELDDDLCCLRGLNLKRYSKDGHSWNGKPYVCIDVRRY